MATLTIEGVPPGLMSRLASAARANGRSVNSEVILSLVRHVREDPPRQEPAGAGAPVRLPAQRLPPEALRALNVSWGDPG